jgi:serine/threonine protein kinase
MCLEVETLLKDVYKIREVLHVSDISIVYLCENTQENNLYIVKEYFPKSLVVRDLDNKSIICKRPSFKDKYEVLKDEFLYEARIIEKIKHPNVVEYIDDFKENNTAYIVTYYYQGETLDKYVAHSNEVLGCKILKNVLIPIGKALKKIHTSGIIHRDIKPNNIMITKEGFPVIIDFGSAINYENKGDKKIFVSSGYSPIELYSKKSRQAEFTDIYSFAAVVYYCVCRVPPLDVKQRILVDDIKHIRSCNQNISLLFSKIIMKNLSLNYKKRFKSVTYFIIGLYCEYFTQKISRGSEY